MGKAEDDMKPGGGKGHERVQVEKDAKDRESSRRLLCRVVSQPLREQGKWP